MISWNNYQRGQCSSPYLQDGAFAKAVNIDIWGRPGIARINYHPLQKSAVSGDQEVTALPKCFAGVGTGVAGRSLFMTDEGYEFYNSNFGTTWTKIAADKGDYCVYWKDYIFTKAANNVIRTYGPLTGSTDDFGFTGALGTGRPMFVSKNDGHLYISNGNALDRLEEIAGQNFADETGSTYTYTSKKVSLPEGYTITSISESREDLLIAATRNSISTNNLPESAIFVWDRSSNSMQNILHIPERQVNCMLSVGTTVYISAGNQGKVFIYTESGVKEYAQIPLDYDNAGRITVGPQGMAWFKDKLFLAVKSSTLNPIGLYSIKNGKVNLETLISSGEDGSNKQLDVGAVYSYEDNILAFGWYDKQNAEYGIDLWGDDYYRWTGYAAYMESPFFRVGTETKRARLRNVEVFLARPLQTGEGLILKYRENINDSWTTLGTFDFATFGAHSSYIFPAGLHELRNVQLRVDLTTGTDSKNTPYLQEIRLT